MGVPVKVRSIVGKADTRDGLTDGWAATLVDNNLDWTVVLVAAAGPVAGLRVLTGKIGRGRAGFRVFLLAPIIWRVV